MLALAAILSRGPRVSALALVGVVAIWLVNAPLAERSNVRTVAAEVTPVIRPGDVVASTQPEQVPVLSRYLPSGVLYVTPLGMVWDERVTDWRNGLDRMRAGKPGRDLLPLLERLGPGRRILLVTPIPNRPLSEAPWKRATRARTREWRRALERDPRLREIEAEPRGPAQAAAEHGPGGGLRGQVSGNAPALWSWLKFLGRLPIHGNEPPPRAARVV